MNTHPSGLEYRAKMNTELLHSQVFRSPDELLRSAERGRHLLESKGWRLIEAPQEA